MAKHGTLAEFDLAKGDWKSYVERAKLYFTAYDLSDTSVHSYCHLSNILDIEYPLKVYNRL